jgi:hypothetical protein
MGQPFLEMRELTRRRRVSTQLEQELAVRGVAQAVVFLEPPDMTVRAPLRNSARHRRSR